MKDGNDLKNSSNNIVLDQQEQELT